MVRLREKIESIMSCFCASMLCPIPQLRRRNCSAQCGLKRIVLRGNPCSREASLGEITGSSAIAFSPPQCMKGRVSEQAR